MNNKSPKTGIFLAVAISMIFCLTLAAGMFFFYKEGNQPKEYQSDDGPGAVAYNYLLALAEKDFNRAYGYLSPDLPGYPPDVDQFILELEERELLPAYEIDPCVYLIKVDQDQDFAKVELRMQYYDPCLKGWWLEVENLSQTPGRIELERIEDSWQIVGGDDWFFFHSCWSDPNQCE